MTRYDKWVARTSGPLDVLAWIFLGAWFFGWLLSDTIPWVGKLTSLISWIVWGAFVIDYLVRLSLTSERWDFVKRHPLDLLMVLVPFLRLLRVALLLWRSVGKLTTERIASSLLIVVASVFVVGSLVEWKFEHLAKSGNIKTIGQAFWWAIETTTTVGYGDQYPVTHAGRIIAAFVMLVGIGLIGTVSASVASWFVTRAKKKADAEDLADGTAVDMHALTAELTQLRAEQAEMKALLTQLVGSTSDARNS